MRLDVDRRDPRPRCSPSLDAASTGLRVGIVDELTDTDGIQPEVKAAVDAAADGARPAPGAKVERVSVPSTMYGLSAYYLIAPGRGVVEPRALRRRALRTARRRRRRRAT